MFKTKVKPRELAGIVASWLPVIRRVGVLPLSPRKTQTHLLSD